MSRLLPPLRMGRRLQYQGMGSWSHVQVREKEGRLLATSSNLELLEPGLDGASTCAQGAKGSYTGSAVPVDFLGFFGGRAL